MSPRITASLIIAIAAAALAFGWTIAAGGGVILAMLAYSAAGTIGLLTTAIGAALIDSAEMALRLRAVAATPTGRSG